MATKRPLKERFYDKLPSNRNPGECWEWQGCKDNQGYGLTSLNYKELRAHRVAWELANGKIPEGKLVCHHCDTPSCCNPDHLYVGTIADNMRDKKVRGRAPRGEANPASKVPDKLVREAIELVRSGSSRAAAARHIQSKGYRCTYVSVSQWVSGELRSVNN